MANRNRKAMSRAIFERLVVAAMQRGVSVNAADRARYIRRQSETDAALMAQADTSVLILSRSQKLVRVTWEGETYLVTFGIAEPDPYPLGVEYAALTPGIFAASILAANMHPSSTVSGSKIKDAIEVEHAGVMGYEGHDLPLVAALFPACLVFRVTASEPYATSGHRFLGAVLSRSYADGPLHLDPETLQHFAFVFESGPEFVPYENLLHGLLSFSWSNLFVETYRCLEQLYAQPRVSALISALPSPLALKEVVALLEHHLSWRPKEDEALMELISSCGGSCLQRLCNAFQVPYAPDAQHKSWESVASRVYKLRNNVVHYRPIHEAVSKSDEEWNQVVRAMLDVVNDVYTRFGEAFFRPIMTTMHARAT